MSNKVPVLMVVFNRPELTKQVFDAVRNYKPERLYVAADGPRAHVEQDLKKCEATRAVFKGVDWDCKVEYLYRDNNLGCGRAVSSAITWFFEQEEEGIILEDDCLPDASFFEYCRSLLAYHRHNSKVMHIGGCNFQYGKTYGEASYYYSSIPHVWGWASWRRAWKHYDFNLSDLNFFLNRKVIEHYVGKGKVHDFWFEIFCKMNQKRIDTWDYQWQYAIWNAGGLAIIPQVNLIKNIGFGADATHTTQDHPFSGLATGTMDKLIHPEVITLNREADDNFFKLSKLK
jgi:hypothetical protein